MNINNFVNLLSLTTAQGQAIAIIRIILIILISVLSLALIIIVLIQPSNSEGMGALSGQSSDTYYAKNRGQSYEGMMKRLTVVLGIIIGVLAITFFILYGVFPQGYTR